MARKKTKQKAESVEVVQAGGTSAIEVLNTDEKQELRRCEGVIKRGWDTFVDVGRALAAIQKQRLYREKYETFEAYCRDRWQYGKSHAHRLIGAAEVIEHLSPIGDKVPLPLNEAQVRPLIGLPPDDQVKAWRAAVEQAGASRVTARLVREAASPFVAPKTRSRGKSGRRRVGYEAKEALEQVDFALAAIEQGDVDRTRTALEKLRGLLGRVA